MVNEKTMKEVKARIKKLEVDVKSLQKRMSRRKEINVTCIHCGYSWECKSKMDNVSCGDCGAKTPNIERVGARKKI